MTNGCYVVIVHNKRKFSCSKANQYNNYKLLYYKCLPHEVSRLHCTTRRIKPLCTPGTSYLHVIWILRRLPRETAVAFQLNSCFSASISLLVVVLLFITVLCLFGDIPPLVSLLPDARLLTFRLFGCCAVRVTLHIASRQ
jgi:hypothetical protein